MYFFHEDHKNNKLMSEQPVYETPSSKKMTIFRAKQERHKMDSNSEQLQNRVNHIVFKQNQTNQKVYSQK